MALTYAKTDMGFMGDKRYWFGLVTFDNAYPAGGEAITPADFGLPTSIQHVLVTNAGGATDHIPHWDVANSKLQLVDLTTEVETVTADQSSTTVHVMVFGY